MQRLRAENAKRKLAEAVRHRWPEFSTETPQESGCAGAEMRFPCALICSVEDKVIVPTPEKKGNVRTAMCSRFEVEMRQKKVQNLFFLPIISKQI